MDKRSVFGAAPSRASQFQSLLEHLDSDRNRAGEKYEELRRKLIKFFEWNACFPAEDLVDETLDRVAGKLGDEEVRDVSAFAWGVAKNVRQEAHKRSARLVQISDLPRQTRSMQKQISVESMLQEKMDQEHRSRCFRLCLLRLTPEDRELFFKYHGANGTTAAERQQLAGQLGMTITALRVRINRMREKIEKCVARCMDGERASNHASPRANKSTVEDDGRVKRQQ